MLCISTHLSLTITLPCTSRTLPMGLLSNTPQLGYIHLSSLVFHRFQCQPKLVPAGFASSSSPECVEGQLHHAMSPLCPAWLLGPQPRMRLAQAPA